VMGALILLKMVFPFILVSCVDNSIMTTLGLWTQNGSEGFVICYQCEVMAIQELFELLDAEHE